MSTTMARAFQDIGYIDPREAAFECVVVIAVDAWRKWSTAAGAGARRDHVKAALQSDRTWVVMERCQPQALALAITWLLSEAERRIADQRPQRDPARAGGGAGPFILDTHGGNARSADPISGAGSKPAGGGLKLNDSQRSSAPATSSPDDAKPQTERQERVANATPVPSHTTPPAPPNRAAERHAAKVSVTLMLCRLQTVLVDGKPIGDCTVSEVKAWAERRKRDGRDAARDVRFALSLVDNLPGFELIRDWVRPEEADAAYARAEAEMNAVMEAGNAT